MAQKPGASSKPDLPPYFNIDPETAEGKLGDPIDTARFAKAAAFAARGRVVESRFLVGLYRVAGTASGSRAKVGAGSAQGSRDRHDWAALLGQSHRVWLGSHGARLRLW